MALEGKSLMDQLRGEALKFHKPGKEVKLNSCSFKHFVFLITLVSFFCNEVVYAFNFLIRILMNTTILSLLNFLKSPPISKMIKLVLAL